MQVGEENSHPQTAGCFKYCFKLCCVLSSNLQNIYEYKDQNRVGQISCLWEINFPPEPQEPSVTKWWVESVTRQSQSQNGSLYKNCSTLDKSNCTGEETFSLLFSQSQPPTPHYTLPLPFPSARGALLVEENRGMALLPTPVWFSIAFKNGGL